MVDRVANARYPIWTPPNALDASTGATSMSEFDLSKMEWIYENMVRISNMSEEVQKETIESIRQLFPEFYKKNEKEKNQQ